MKGGESFTKTRDVFSEKKVLAKSFAYIEADSSKQVTEASEFNNWRTLNPASAAVPLTQNQCMPKM